MRLIWNNREDLKVSFPDIDKRDVKEYWKWWINGGSKEYNISSKLPLKIDNLDIPKIIKILVDMFLSRREDLQEIFKEPLNKDKDIFLYWWLINHKEVDIFEDDVIKYFIERYHVLELDKDNNCKITPLMRLIWNNREDLKVSFPDIDKRDVKEYWKWWINGGSKEYNISINKTLIKENKISTGIDIVPNKKEFNKNNINIALIGHGTGIFGLGEDARLISSSLETVGINVDMYVANENMNIGHIKNLKMKKLNDYQDIYDFNIFCLPAFDMLGLIFEYDLKIFTSCINIGIWQWELSQFPTEANFAFELVHSILAISDFSAESISKNTTKTVKSIYLPVIKENFEKKNYEYFNLPTDKFLYFFSFDGGSFINRKNPLSIIESFQRSFKNENDVGLVIKIMNPPSNSDLWNECLRRIHNDDRIYMINKTLNRKEFLALLSLIDVVISLHRAEGFGRLMAEAFLYDKPSIASNYSGNLQYMNHNNSYLVEGKLLPLYKNDYLFGDGKVWFEPNINEAAKLMYHCYINRMNNYEKVELGKLYIEKYHSLLNTGHQIKDEILEIIKLNIGKNND
jgi:hypothetical protein